MLKRIHRPWTQYTALFLVTLTLQWLGALGYIWLAEHDYRAVAVDTTLGLAAVFTTKSLVKAGWIPTLLFAAACGLGTLLALVL